MTSKLRILNQFSVLATAFLLFAGGASATRAQGSNTGTSQTSEAKILLTAIDKDGRFVNSLRAEDLRVLQDGLPQKIDGFQQITDRVLSLVILIDTSASQERVLPGQRLARGIK